VSNITDDAAAFENLSIARQKKLGREARIFCAQHPYLRDANGYWRSLSAGYVAALGFQASQEAARKIQISTDEATMTIDATSADQAAREFGYASAAALRRAVERSGGYGSLVIDGVTVWRVAR